MRLRFRAAFVLTLLICVCLAFTASADTRDIVRVMMSVEGIRALTPSELTSADLDGNGFADMRDALINIYKSAGFDVETEADGITITASADQVNMGAQVT